MMKEMRGGREDQVWGHEWTLKGWEWETSSAIKARRANQMTTDVPNAEWVGR